MNYADRSFGVEIECSTNGQGKGGTEKLLERNGFDRWAGRIVYDGSEIEIRSPVLWGTPGLNELKGVMNLLKANGYSTTEDDGMHCHFDARDLSEEDIARIIRSWDSVQENVQKFLGDRFYSDYCTYDYDFNSLGKKRSNDPDDESYWDYWRNSVWSYDGEKMYAIEPRQRLGTLEFRQHYGTLEFDDARSWILLVQAFIKTVKGMDKPMRKISMETLFERTRTYKVAQKNLANRKFAYGERVYS